MKTFKSNCIVEAIRAKVRHGNKVRIVHLRSHDGLHHWGWLDKEAGILYDFHQMETVKHWIQLLWYRGYIMERKWRDNNG